MVRSSGTGKSLGLDGLDPHFRVVLAVALGALVGGGALLLEDDDLKIYEIAARIGYSDVDYFSKKFRSQEGISPADYRRQLRADKQQENIQE